MKNYRPKSWSQQARELGERAIQNVNVGAWSIDRAIHFFKNSYRHSRIRYRAVKRFRRAILRGKIYEHPSSIQKWEEFKKEWEYD